MVPARNLLQGHRDGYGGGCYDMGIHRKGFYQGGGRSSVSPGFSAMADDESRSGGDDEEGGGRVGEGRGKERGEVGTSSSEGEKERDGSWLCLSIGRSGGGAGRYSGRGGGRLKPPAGSEAPERPKRAGELQQLLELDLFKERAPPNHRRPAQRPPIIASAPPAPGISAAPAAMAPFFPPHGGPGLLGYRPYVPGVTRGFWSPQASSSSTRSRAGPYINPPLFGTSAPGSSGPPAQGESSAAAGQMRVVNPPSSRPHAGVWFVLQASQNQAREPFLPQIPKCYLRIKDGRMTVWLLMKYLVNKLGLDSELEVEITCGGRWLHPFLTLQHVRDSIWCPGGAVASPPPSSHVMILQYGRSA